MTTDLTTLPEVKEYLGIPPLQTTNDALLSRLITASSAYMESLMSRTIALQTYTEVRNGLGGQSMVLFNQPIVSVAALMIDGVTIPPRPPLGPGAITGYGFGYNFDDTRLFVSGVQFCRGFQNVVCMYTGGFATVPPDLDQACIEMVGDWYKYRDRIGKLSEGIEGQTISFARDQIPPRVLGVILTYKRVAPIY